MVGTSLAALAPAVEARLQDDDGGGGGHNAHLRALLWAKARSMAVRSPRQALALVASSPRCVQEELRRKGYPSPAACAPVALVLREWKDMDPMFELRGFVHHGRLRGLTQMASMGIQGVHRYRCRLRKGKKKEKERKQNKTEKKKKKHEGGGGGEKKKKRGEKIYNLTQVIKSRK